MGVATEIGEAGVGGLTAGDLAELMTTFNEVTLRLESTHARLRGEVVRLRGELREANEQLERSRRLAALGEMAAGISHEIRNPLGSISLYARMLDQDLVDRPGERAIAGKIAQAVRGLDGVVSDVLSFAREIRLRPEPVTAGELFEAAVSSCADVLGAAGVVVERSGEGVELVCDRGLMVQALVNVVRNAAEAMGRAGEAGVGRRARLRLGAERLVAEGLTGVTGEGGAAGEAGEAGAAGEASWVRLRVEDSGPGVSAEVRARMFNPFFTTRETGTGLGLAIVHRIVDAHGGRVDVVNVERGGPAVKGDAWAGGEVSGARVVVEVPACATGTGGGTLSVPAREHMKLRVVGR